jgi:hypothetical protein
LGYDVLNKHDGKHQGVDYPQLFAKIEAAYGPVQWPPIQAS